MVWSLLVAFHLVCIVLQQAVSFKASKNHFRDTLDKFKPLFIINFLWCLCYKTFYGCN
jgi:hypothetical protein